MSADMMNTKEVAEYLGINEKQVYALIKEKKIPCTRVTGKWLFPRHLIDGWIDSNSRDGLKAGRKIAGIKTIVAAGSNDPILDVLLNSMKQRSPDFYIFSCSTGSTEGLRLLSENQADIAWCHLFDPQSGSYNIPHVSSRITDRKIAVVHLFYRQIGLVAAAGLPFSLADFGDLCRGGVRFINRQAGSGTRIFLDYNLDRLKIDPSSIPGYDREVFTHIEVGLAILSGEANAGIATVAVSRLFGLPFVQLARESFDMVLSQETFFKKEIQTFIETLNSEEFRKKVGPLGNYDFTESGKILFSN